MFRRRRQDPAAADPLAAIDPALAPRRFRAVVDDALATRRRFASLLAGVSPGPTRERLVDMGQQLDAGVAAVWATVMRVGEVERVIATLDPDDVTADYKQAKRSGASPEVVAAHEARFHSVQRLMNSLDDVDERLNLLEARLGGVVAQAAEVAIALSGSATNVDALDAELSQVVDELDGLRLAFDELK